MMPPEIRQIHKKIYEESSKESLIKMLLDLEDELWKLRQRTIEDYVNELIQTQLDLRR